MLLQVLKFVVLWNYFQMIWICWFFCQRIYKIIRGKSNNVFSLKIIRIYISIEKISVLSISYDSTREISQNVSFLKIIFCILEEVIIVFRMTLEFICESLICHLSRFILAKCRFNCYVSFDYISRKSKENTQRQYIIAVFCFATNAKMTDMNNLFNWDIIEISWLLDWV